MKIRSISLVALPVLLIGGLVLSCAVFSHAERGADHQPLVGEEVEELLTENLEEECFRSRSNTIGSLLFLSEERRFSVQSLFTTCDASAVNYSVARFSVQTIPLRI